MLYEAFYEGKMPKPKADAKGGKGRPTAKPIPRQAMRDLEAEIARMRQLQEGAE